MLNFVGNASQPLLGLFSKGLGPLKPRLAPVTLPSGHFTQHAPITAHCTPQTLAESALDAGLDGSCLYSYSAQALRIPDLLLPNPSLTSSYPICTPRRRNGQILVPMIELSYYGGVSTQQSRYCIAPFNATRLHPSAAFQQVATFDVQATEEAAALMVKAKGSYGNGVGEERSLLITPVVGLREYAESLESNGQLKPRRLYQRQSGQYVAEVLPQG